MGYSTHTRSAGRAREGRVLYVGAIVRRGFERPKRVFGTHAKGESGSGGRATSDRAGLANAPSCAVVFPGKTNRLDN